MNHSNAIVQFLEEKFNEKKCYEFCLRHNFIVRSSSKLKGYEFIKTMIIPSEGLSTDSLKGLCKRILHFNPKADLSAQALCKRINDISSGVLMQAIFKEILLQVHEKITQFSKGVMNELSGFYRVLVEDSTVAQLNNKLEARYTGTNRGGKGVKAQIKIDVIHDLKSGSTIDARLFRGNEPDQGLACRILSFLKGGELVIRDLGYFVLKSLKGIADMGSYFLSRVKANTNFFLNREDENPLDLSQYLKKKVCSGSQFIEIKGYVGSDKVAARLIIYGQPQEVTNKRLRDAIKNARNQSFTLSESKKLALSYSMFITNAPEELLSAGMVGTVYRLRWEIELVFKRWKSQLEIDHLEGIKEERIDCLIWSRLCTIVIIELITGYFKQMVKSLFNIELSEVKLIQYLMRNDVFLTAVIRNKLESFFKQMKKDVRRMLLKDSRVRKTMRERVLSKENYYGYKSLKDN